MSEPPILSYDQPSVVKDRRSSRILPGYFAGVLAAGAIYSFVAYFFLIPATADAFSRVLNGLVLPVSFAFLSILPQSIFLGLTLVLKRRIFREVRFRGFRAAFFWGFAGGLMPWPLLPVAQNSSVALPDPIWFAVLAWFVLFPITAGLFLCHRSHLRD